MLYGASRGLKDCAHGTALMVPTVTLGKIANISSGGTPDRKNSAFWNGTIPWVKTAQIQNCTITAEDIDESITQEGLEQSSAKMLPKGTILMAMYGQGKTRGQVAILGLDATINQACAAIRLRRDVDRDYVYQQLLFRYDAIRALSNTGSQENLNADLIREIAFPLPEIQAQKKTARLLAEWDAAIEKTERLIAATERQYRATSKRLVWGNQFLQVPFSNLVMRVNRKNTAGNGRPLTVSGREGLISQADYFDKRIAAEKTEHYILIRKGEFAYNRSYMKGYPYGAIKRLDRYDEGIVSTLCLCFAIKHEAPLDSNYLVHFCEAGGFDHEIHKVAQEGARNHGLLNISMDDFFNVRMPLPPLKEQRAITELLDAAEHETSLLLKQSAALKQQKRGLMQKLLTGQRRLKPRDAEAA